MSLARTIAVLAGAALLEVGGDALIRRGLQQRWGLLVAGALSLVAYGVLVNQGGLEFGRLLGVYIAAFFLISQAIGFVVFGNSLTWQVWLGGALIVSGGLVLLL